MRVDDAVGDIRLSLTQNASRTVDDVAGNVCSSLTGGAGKGLGKHLKPLLPSWWSAIHDPAAEVAAEAGLVHLILYRCTCLFVLTMYRCARAHSPHILPWPGHSFPFQLNLTVCS